MTRDQAIDLARSLAVAQGAGYSAPAYLPRNVVQAEGFMPHEWVIGAITAAFDAGQAKQAAVTEKAFEAVNRNADLGEAATQELRNIAEAKRYDRERFDDDTSFADWAQSRARHALGDDWPERPPHDVKCECAEVGPDYCPRHTP